jgi:hypothetical protein
MVAGRLPRWLETVSQRPHDLAVAGDQIVSDELAAVLAEQTAEALGFVRIKESPTNAFGLPSVGPHSFP